MPMIDIYAVTGTFSDIKRLSTHGLAVWPAFNFPRGGPTPPVGP